VGPKQAFHTKRGPEQPRHSGNILDLTPLISQPLELSMALTVRIDSPLKGHVTDVMDAMGQKLVPVTVSVTLTLGSGCAQVLAKIYSQTDTPPATPPGTPGVDTTILTSVNPNVFSGFVPGNGLDICNVVYANLPQFKVAAWAKELVMGGGTVWRKATPTEPFGHCDSGP
jgi:hypothetical protein